MIRVEFEEKTDIFDDVVLNWYIESPLNDYRLTMQFCGAIDEDGNEDLNSSCFCEISINEVENHKSYIIDTIKERIENDINIELEESSMSILLYAPDVRSSLYYRDESSLDSSVTVAKAFLKHLSAAVDSEIEDIDLTIDSYIYESEVA